MIATDPTAGTPTSTSAAPVSKRARKQKRALAPRANFGMRWLFPLAIIGLAVATVLLGLNAKDLVLNSRDGNIAKAPTDPAAPGFAAEVVPTPTLLVLQTTEKNELVSVAIMSLASNDGGGTMLFLPSDLIVTLPTGDSATLAKVYGDAVDGGTGGQLALKRILTRLIDADIDSSIEVGPKALEALIRPVAPLQYTLRENVRSAKNTTLLPLGPVSIADADQVLAATEILGPNEASINRTSRQMLFWQAWFDALHKVQDKSTVFPALDPEPELVRFAKSFGTGTAKLQLAPFTESNFRGLALLIADTAGIAKIAQTMIPYPVGYEPGARLLVEVRNGVGDLTRNEPMNRKIVLAGGQIVVLGNTEAFGVPATSVVFYDEELRTRVTAFAKSAGLPDPVFVDRPGSSIEVTVTIGADFTS